MQNKATGNLFGTPAELDDAWLFNHKDHIIYWMKQTVFDNGSTIGNKYKVCICYTCKKIACQLLGKEKAPIVTVAYKELEPLFPIHRVRRKRLRLNFNF